MQFAADPLTLAVALGLLPAHVLDVTRPKAQTLANVPVPDAAVPDRAGTSPGRASARPQ